MNTQGFNNTGNTTFLWNMQKVSFKEDRIPPK